MRKNKRNKCPVCGEVFLCGSVNLHITRISQSEAMAQMAQLINRYYPKPVVYSSILLLRNCPHWKYYRKHRTIRALRALNRTIYDL